MWWLLRTPLCAARSRLLCRPADQLAAAARAGHRHPELHTDERQGDRRQGDPAGGVAAAAARAPARPPEKPGRRRVAAPSDEPEGGTGREGGDGVISTGHHVNCLLN